MTKSAIQALDEDTSNEEENCNGYCLQRKVGPQWKGSIRYSFRKNYMIMDKNDKPLFGNYEKEDGGLSSHIETMMEEYETELDTYDDRAATIEAVIRQAFADGRDLPVQNEVNSLEDAGYCAERSTPREPKNLKSLRTSTFAMVVPMK